MPEIGEVARAVHYIRKHLVGKTLSKVIAQDDANVYGKVGTSGAEFQKALTGKKVIGAGQQGKYFWMVMSSPPHPVMHFGMAGWLKFKDEHTYYYKPKKGEEKEEWPPKYWKFIMTTSEEPFVEAAFCDLRRFGRIRLVNCAADQLRKTSPLVENGPDPVIDKDVVTVEWLTEKCRAKKVPVKAMLLDQANISGIGNWVGDEIMYNAKIHPEQYANSLQDDQIERLHKSIHYVCSTAVELLADSDQFPESWLFKHRWGKGKKDTPNTLPGGEKIVFLTVGGRTSAVVPSIQKKTGPVVKEMSEAEGYDEEPAEKPKKASGRKRKSNADDDVVEAGAKVETPKGSAVKKRKAQLKMEDESVTRADGRETNHDGTIPTSRTGRKSKFKEELNISLNDAATQDSGIAQHKKQKLQKGKTVETANDERVKTKKGKVASQPKAEEALVESNAARRRSGRLGK